MTWVIVGVLFLMAAICMFAAALVRPERPTSSAHCPVCNQLFEADTEDNVGDLLYLHILANHREPPEEDQ